MCDSLFSVCLCVCVPPGCLCSSLLSTKKVTQLTTEHLRAGQVERHSPPAQQRLNVPSQHKVSLLHKHIKSHRKGRVLQKMCVCSAESGTSMDLKTSNKLSFGLFWSLQYTSLLLVCSWWCLHHSFISSCTLIWFLPLSSLGCLQCQWCKT